MGDCDCPIPAKGGGTIYVVCNQRQVVTVVHASRPPEGPSRHGYCPIQGGCTSHVPSTLLLSTGNAQGHSSPPCQPFTHMQ